MVKPRYFVGLRFGMVLVITDNQDLREVSQFEFEIFFETDTEKCFWSGFIKRLPPPRRHWLHRTYSKSH
jgi:hypothetical protein